MQVTASEVSGRAMPARPARALGPLLAAGCLAVLPAALWSVALLGRTTLGGLSAPWALTWLAGSLTVLWWAVRGSSPPVAAIARNDERAGASALTSRAARNGALGLVPVAALSLAALVVLYRSNSAYHAWTFTPMPKGLLLSSSFLLVALAPAVGLALGDGWRAAVGWLKRFAWLGTVIGLGAAGVLHALSYSAVATDDLIRYWAIADAWAEGAIYAVAEGTPGSSAFYLVDVPFYPALVAVGFQLVGHRYLALHLPLVAANVVLPFLLYGASRAAGAGRLAALGLSLAVVSLPVYQVYALGSAEPDPLFAALLAALAWLALRCASGATRPTWVALGVMAALVVLTRPEGPLYAGPLFLGFIWAERHTLLALVRRDRFQSGDERLTRLGNLILAGVVATLPVAAFSAFLVWAFGIVWPTGWGNVASPTYVVPNLTLVIRQNLPNYAATSGLPAPAVTGQLLGLAIVLWVLAGLWLLSRHFAGLRLWALPILLNLAVIFMSPTYLAADHLSPPTFFRHFAITVPWLVPPLAAALAWLGARVTALRGGAQRARWLAQLGALAFGVALLGELSVLGGIAGRNQSGVPTVLTSDPWMLVTDLWRANDSLPALPFRSGAGRGVFIDDAFPYMAFRTGLFDAMRPNDLHTNDAGRAYALALAVLGLASIAWCTFAQRAVGPPAPPAGAQSV